MVPDAIYLASLDHAVTAEEITFRELLTFHRDVLNGGLDQALGNAESAGRLAPVLGAYRAAELSAVADIVEVASVRLLRGDDDVDELTDRYVQLAYGEDNDQPDAVEGAAVRYAQTNEAAFDSIVTAAKSGDFGPLNIGGQE
jgi:hypothetical protein